MTMQSQDIFKAFGSNWKWASITKSGTARVHTEQPTFSADGVVCYSMKENTVERVPAFNLERGSGSRIIDRTDFTNGPQYPTDRFGIPFPAPVAVEPQQQQPAPLPARGYCSNGDCWNEKAIGWNQCETHRPPLAPAPAAATLTTDEAENGGLWAFANHDENYVHVNSFGVVWFDLFKDCPKPRRSYAVEVSGVVNPIERVRSKPVSPAEAGMPFAPTPVAQPCFDYQPAHPGLREEGLESPEADEGDHGWSDGVAELEKKLSRQRRVLKKAKARAKALLSIYNADGSTQLTCVQYTAIFGELPV